MSQTNYIDDFRKDLLSPNWNNDTYKQCLYIDPICEICGIHINGIGKRCYKCTIDFLTKFTCANCQIKYVRWETKSNWNSLEEMFWCPECIKHKENNKPIEKPSDMIITEEFMKWVLNQTTDPQIVINYIKQYEEIYKNIRLIKQRKEESRKEYDNKIKLAEQDLEYYMTKCQHPTSSRDISYIIKCDFCSKVF